MKAPDYDWSDVVWLIGGLIAGGITYFTLLILGVDRWSLFGQHGRTVVFVIAVLVGGPVGYSLKEKFLETRGK